MQLVLLVPLITMRLFAEERRGGTLELLLTSPVREIDIVLAKFVAAMADARGDDRRSPRATRSSCGCSAGPDWGPVYSGYLGLLLLGGALVSIGLAVSALTSNQIVAAVVSLGLFGLLWAIDTLGGAAAGADRQLGARPVAAGALHALRRRRHVHLRFRLLPDRHPARAVPDSAGAGAALKRWNIDSLELVPLLWLGGWLVAVVGAVLRPRCGCRSTSAAAPGAAGSTCAGIVLAAVGVCVLANVALHLHDAHVDLTREKVYTPSAAALQRGRRARPRRRGHLLLSARRTPAARARATSSRSWRGATRTSSRARSTRTRSRRSPRTTASRSTTPR